jgi:ATP-dependent Clp protease ATP-binding subunit ClpC
MFERFTDRARRVVVLAQEEARVLNHHYVGTEHILLGLIHEGDGVAAKALESLGISLETVRQQVEEIIGRGEQPPTGHIPFTPRAKKVLELSLREALQLGHNYIGTEHILLGMISEGKGVAAQVLVRLGADQDRVRQEVTQLLHAHRSRTESSGPSERSSGPSERSSGPSERSSRPSEGQREEAVRPRGAVAREFWLTEMQDALTKIADRLTAIERHLGMTAHPAGSGDSPGAKSAEEPDDSPAEKPGEKPADPPGDKPDGGPPSGSKAVGE